VRKTRGFANTKLDSAHATEDEEVFVAEAVRQVSRFSPDPDEQRDDVHFLITVPAEHTEVVAYRLRATFMGADVRTEPTGLIRMYRGEYAPSNSQDWRNITEIQVEEVVQNIGQLLHIVLAPDPTFIDAIQMRVNHDLGDEQMSRLRKLGLNVVRVDEPINYGSFLYRLTPGVGNEWPSRDMIADALDASHSSPQDPDRW
jgi:hypothetical protein